MIYDDLSIKNGDFPKSISGWLMINNDLMMRLRINGFFLAEW
jgi:hypothetical protein